MAAKVALCPLWNALTALFAYQHRIPGRCCGELTQAIRTFLGSDVFGSLTLTKANWMRPSENSSIRSSSSPSVQSQHRCLAMFPKLCCEVPTPRAWADTLLQPESSPRLGVCWLHCMHSHWGSAACIPHTSGALNLQDALFSAVLLECADKRGSYCEDSPLTICGRACLGTRWRRGIDDILVAPGDVGAVAGGVERGHGGSRRSRGEAWGMWWRRGRQREKRPRWFAASTMGRTRHSTGIRMCVCVIGRELS